MLERPEFSSREAVGDNEQKDALGRKIVIKDSHRAQRMSFVEKLRGSFSKEQLSKMPNFPNMKMEDLRDKADSRFDQMGDNLF